MATLQGAENLVRSPMHAKVSSINVVDGQDVTAGDTVLVLEAMKMEHSIKAPKGGILKLSAQFSMGEMIEHGRELFRID